MTAKELRQKAGELYTQAKAIMDEHKANGIPAEKQAEVDGLLDQVETLTGQAKAAETAAARESRVAEMDAFFNKPAESKNLFAATGEGAKVEYQGKQLSAAEVAELQAMAPHKAFVAALNPEYKEAYVAFLRKGFSGLNAAEQKALSAGDPGAGGYLVQDTYLSIFLTKQRDVSAMRRIGRVLPPVPSGSAIAAAQDSFLSDAEWTTEVLTGSLDTVKPFGQRKLTPKPLAKGIKVSNTLLRNPFFDVEAWVRDNMAYKHAVPEESAFINGDGVNKPLGLLHSTAAIPKYTTASSTALHGDDVINWIYTLKQGYASRPSTRILCNRSFIRKVRTLASKNASVNFTNYLWQPGLAAGAPNTIGDIAYEVSDQYPTGLSSDAFVANSLVATIGDFSYYWIADALQMSIQRVTELYAATNETGYFGRKETDGMPALAEAFLNLEIKA